MALATDAIIRNIPVDENGNYVGPGLQNFVESSGAGAMSETILFAKNSVVLGVKLHVDAGATTPGAFTCVSDDITLMLINWEMFDETDFFQFWKPEFPFKAGTTLTFVWANADANNWTMEVIWREQG